MKKIMFLLSLVAIGLLTSYKLIQFPAVLASWLKEQQTNYPKEKVYIQLDKPLYVPGETIWFNTTVLMRESLTPTRLSGKLFVVLKDPAGKKVKQKVLSIDKGVASGYFDISNRWNGGVYEIVAFTKWMQNYGEEVFFKRKVQVQKVQNPALIFDVELNKKSYSPGNRVSMDIEIKDLQNEPIAGGNLHYTVMVGGKKWITENRTTKLGIENYSFELPTEIGQNRVNFIIEAEYQGIKESYRKSIPINHGEISVEFFPEGESIIAGRDNTVVFTAENSVGGKVDIQAVVVNSSLDTLSAVNTIEQGLGKFTIRPLDSEEYYLLYKSTDQVQRFKIPDVTMTGTSLRVVEHSSDEIILDVYSSDYQELILTAVKEDKLVYSQEFNLNNRQKIIEVNSEDWKSGIVHFMLWNKDNQIINRRPVFLYRERDLMIDIAAHKESYSPGEKVKLKIKTRNNKGEPVQARLGLSVVDERLLSIVDDKQDHIGSWVYMNSELKNRQAEPLQLFDSPKAKDLQDLLLVSKCNDFIYPVHPDSGRVSLKYLPDSENYIAGKVKNEYTKKSSFRVYYIELTGKRRITSVKTDPTGHFLFKNIDKEAEIMILVKKPYTVELIDKIPSGFLEFSGIGNVNNENKNITDEFWLADAEEQKPAAPDTTSLGSQINEDMVLQGDVTQLSEVVVVGYSNMSRSALTSSVSVIESNLVMNNSIFTALAGSVAGVRIIDSGVPGSSAQIQMRGVSSLSTDPLIIINGMPLSKETGTIYSDVLREINTDDIERITVLKSTDAAALYGMAGSNGVIQIELKNRFHFKRNDYYTVAPPVRLNHVIKKPLEYDKNRRFLVVNKQMDESLQHNTTLFWNPDVITNSKGEASVEFITNRRLTTYRITAEGFTLGAVGYATERMVNQDEVIVNFDLPNFIGLEDQPVIPVSVYNNKESDFEGDITFIVDEEMIGKEHISIPAKTAIYEHFHWHPHAKRPKKVTARVMLHQGEQLVIEQNKSTQIIPVGMEEKLEFEGSSDKKDYTFQLNNPENGNVNVVFSVYSDFLAQLNEGAASIFRQPHGCFEQVSSSTFPNILALRFLRETSEDNLSVESKARSYIATGYKKLMAYEISSGGFDWWGKKPSHEGLSAYGLVEFFEMAKVYDGVDPGVIKRTSEWLLSRKDNKGGFKRNAGKYGFAAASQEVNNAYILFALSSTGTNYSALEMEYELALNEAFSSKDMYRLGLMAITAANFKQWSDYSRALIVFQQEIKNKGLQELSIEQSLVSSGRPSLINETVSLWVLAYVKGREFSPEKKTTVRGLVQFLSENRRFGGYGSSQATAMSLLAITEYLLAINEGKNDIVNEVNLYMNDSYIGTVNFNANKEKVRYVIPVDEYHRIGQNNFRIEPANASHSMPDFDLGIQYYAKSKQFQGHDIEIATFFSKDSLKLNDFATVRVQLKNQHGKGIGSTMAEIGIPAGVQFDPVQLKEYQEEGKYQYYEINDQYLILYFNEMGPKEIKKLEFDVKAVMPGTYLAPSNKSYLYYFNQNAYYELGKELTIYPN